MLTTDNAVLVVIDVQTKLMAHIHNKECLIAALCTLIRGCQVLEIPILWNEQYPQGLGETVPEVAQLLRENSPIEKVCFSSCQNPEFAQELSKSRRSHVMLAGIETHVCVYQTAVDLLDQGYPVEIVSDAVSSRTAANKQLALDKLQRLGANLTGVEMALFELLREAKGPRFKEISRLVR